MEHQKVKDLTLRAKQRLKTKTAKAAAFLALVKTNEIDREASAANEKSAITYKSQKTSNTEIKQSVTEDKDLEQLRAEMRARKRAIMMKPKIYLTLTPEGKVASTDRNGMSSSSGTLPIFVMDVQHLLMFAVQGNTASYKPRWCKLLRVEKMKHVVVAIVTAASSCDLVKYKDCFPNIESLFEMSVDIVCPEQYGSSVLDDLFSVPLSISQLKKLNINLPKQTPAKEEASMSEVISRVDLLMSTDLMVKDNYPLPIDSEQYAGYVYTKRRYDAVTDKSPLFAIDCEMCYTTAKLLELTRVSVVTEKLEVIYDVYVKPYNHITDYLTRFSGITKDVLENVTKRLQNVQNDLRQLLPKDAILCGQSLNSDLHALKMFHPYVIDTSVIYNLTGDRNYKPALRRLTAEFLGKTIQDSPSGHSPVEDSVATMELVLLKLKHGMAFGDVILGSLSMRSNKPNINEKNISSASCDSKRDISDISNEITQNKKRKLDTANEVTKLDSSLTEESSILDQGITNKEELGRRLLFFQQDWTLIYNNFFTIISKNNKTGSMVSAENDKDSVHQARELVSQQDFTSLKLTQYQKRLDDGASEEEIEVCLKKIDKRIKKLHKNVPENSLLVVLFSGRMEQHKTLGAKCFVKIT